MKRILVCTGVLGGGTALVFALAALTAIAFPQGTRVAAGWNGGPWVKDVWGGGVAVPVPAPAIEVAPAPVEVAPFVIDRGADGVALPDAGFKPLHGELVVPEADSGTETAPSP
jgi:hypothetical protein